MFFDISAIVITVFFIGLVAEILVLYLRAKNKCQDSIFSKLSNPAFLPMIICLIQFLVVRENLVGFVYRNICKPKNDISLILILIFVVCYFLAIAFCHFSNAYCGGVAFKEAGLASVAQRLGHSSMTTTQKTYLHIIQELENKDVDLVMRSLSSLN